MAAATTRVPLVDALRGIAALLVVLYHGFARSGADAVAPVASRLDVGIAVFFVISGFLLYAPFARSRLAGSPAPATGAYAWRRALRIVPAYWVALALAGVWLGMDYLWTARGAALHFGFAQVYSVDALLNGLPQAWTLSIEVAFYAFLPAYAAILRRVAPSGVRAEWVGLAALVAVALAYRLGVTLSAPDPERVNTRLALLWLPAYLDHFALGMGLAVVACTAPERLERIPPWGAWTAAGIAFAVLCFGIGLEGEFLETMSAGEDLARHVLFAAVAVFLLLPALGGAPEEGAIRTLLASRPLIGLGVISYGLYLWHYPLQDRLQAWDLVERTGVHPYLVYVGGGVLGGVALGWASWRLVERPALRLKRRVPDRAAPPRDAVNADPAR